MAKERHRLVSYMTGDILVRRKVNKYLFRTMTPLDVQVYDLEKARDAYISIYLS